MNQSLSLVFFSRLECGTHRVAALGSDVWQKRNRSSLRPFPKAYLLAILQLGFSFALCLLKQAGKDSEISRRKGWKGVLR